MSFTDARPIRRFKKARLKAGWNHYRIASEASAFTAIAECYKYYDKAQCLNVAYSLLR